MRRASVGQPEIGQRDMAKTVDGIDCLRRMNFVADVRRGCEEEFHLAGRQIVHIADGRDVIVGAGEEF